MANITSSPVPGNRSSRKQVFYFGLVTASLIILLSLSHCTGNQGSKEKGDVLLADTITTSIVISPDVPFDLKNPSDLKEAAEFAWNEFIALTWPAKAQGPTEFPRGQAQTDAKYGSAGPTGQVVWETYRHRVEAFPGMGDPNGYDPSKPDLGFGAKPNYIYSNGPIPPLNKNADTSKIPPFNNLDEVTQISLNSMYAGAYGHHDGFAGNKSVPSQKILFQAKVNEDYYKYVAGNKYYQSDSPNVANIIFNSGQFAQTGDGSSYPPPYTNLPASNATEKKQGAIEVKAAWRRLNPKTEDISKFYTARVRYYSGTPDDQVKGYVDSDDPAVNEVWGLVALHIIHKTPNAPSFVYATFSQYNNILDSAGNSVEDADGNTLPQYLSMPPFSPAMDIIPAKDSSHPNQVVFTTGGKVNTATPQLYFQNVAGKEAINIGSPTGPLYSGPVNVNRRIFPIPATIVQANATAHALMKKVNPNAVWLNYKLVNVQAEPLDYIADSVKINNGLQPTYFLANEVVETNPSLQHFSGGLNVLNGTIFNYQFNFNTHQHLYDYNVFNRNVSPAKTYLMGGCMGCHGSQGQKAGGDFSVLLANGRILNPDVEQLNDQDKVTMALLTRKYLPKAAALRK